MDAMRSSSDKDALGRAHNMLVTLHDRVNIQLLSKYSQDPAEAGSGGESRRIGQLERQLKGLCGQVAQLRRVREVMPGEHRIGVFGASNRGKSSLINSLLGVSILPVQAVPTTALEIELRHDPRASAGRFRVIHGVAGVPEEMDSVDEAAHRLEQVAVRHDTPGSARTRVTVEGAFENSAVLQEGRARALVDTPGADGLLGTEDESLRLEGDRALDAMQELDAVLFCVRLDLLSNSDDGRLFHDQCKTLRPIVVATYLDQWHDARDPGQAVAKWLEVPVGRVVCLDARPTQENESSLREAIATLVALVESELKEGTGGRGDECRALQGLNFILHPEAMHEISRMPWPLVEWHSLRAVLDGEALEIWNRIEQRRCRCSRG